MSISIATYYDSLMGNTCYIATYYDSLMGNVCLHGFHQKASPQYYTGVTTNSYTNYSFRLKKDSLLHRLLVSLNV